MSSFLFAMFEGGGNVPLLVPIVRAVVERGHDVTVVAGPSIRRPNPPPAASPRLVDRLREAGARVVQLLDEPLHPLDGFVLGTAILGRTPPSLDGAVDAGRIARWSLPWAERLAPVIEDTQPEVLVCDFFLYGALAAGEAAVVPTAALVHYRMLSARITSPRSGGLRARG